MSPGSAGPAGPQAPGNPGAVESGHGATVRHGVKPDTGPQPALAQNTLQFGHVGDARKAQLVLWPPTDVANAKVSVSLSPGLRFSDVNDAGGTRTVRNEGPVKKSEPIKVPLDLTAVAPGLQTVDVTLARVEVSNDAPQPDEVIHHETLQVYVAAP